MPTQEEIKDKILKLAENDESIRAVLLNGSRANPHVKPDKYQDFDITFIVNNFNEFVHKRAWMYALGKPVLQQLPDEMNPGSGEKEEHFSFAFLMIFEDGNRIDLTLFPLEKFKTHFATDSLTIIWMDKDSLFANIPASSDKDYHITKPDQQEFSEVCNEFWWTITNVAKGLKRDEIIYAKDMLENVVRPMFLKIIAWKVGQENGFHVSIGKSAKFAGKFLSAPFYDNVLKTYSDSNTENNWNALFLMADIFKKEQNKLAEKLSFSTNASEIENSIKYLQKLRYE